MEVTFDRAGFNARLATRHLGRHLVDRAETESTNDDAWDLVGQGAPDGSVVIADHQTRGRGRMGRTWHSSDARGLAMSVLLHLSCEPDMLATLPLVAGLALSQAFDRLGVDVELKWPNDLLLDGRKLAGILCEGRKTASGIQAAVVGVGVNVSQRVEDFPPELRDRATSLIVHGHDIGREIVAAEFLNALEPLWTEHAEGDRRAALDAWRRRARFWGRELVVRTPAGDVRGIARDLADDGALVIETAPGAMTKVIAGDVDLGSPPSWVPTA